MGYEVKDVNPKERIWLVRSSTKLLGPYNLEEIVELLKSNQISFVDEIRRPKTRWHFIRDYPYLTETVKQFREKINSQQTKTSPLSAITATFTKTDSVSDFKNEPVDIDYDEIKDIEPLKEVPFTFNPKAKNQSAVVSNQAAVAKSYGLLNDLRVKEQIEERNKKIKKMLIAGAVAVLAVSFMFFITKIFLDSQKQKRLYEQISIDYKQKLYTKSFSSYQLVKNTSDIPRTILDVIMPLRITLGREVNNTKSELNKTLEDTSTKRKSEIHNLLGLIVSIEGDANQAFAHFQSSLADDPSFEYANINWLVQNLKTYSNLPMTETLKKTLIENFKVVEKTRYQNFENASYFALLEGIFAFKNPSLWANSSGSIDSTLKSIEESILEQIEKSSFLKSELYVLYFALAKINKTEVDLSRYDDFLSQIPRHSSDFSKDPSIDWTYSDWKEIEPICEQIFADSQLLYPKLIRSFCALESGNYSKAESILGSAVLQAAGNSALYDLTQLNLAYLKQSTMMVENYFKKSDFATYPSAQYYKAQICSQSGKKECAIENYKKLMETNYKHIAARELFRMDLKYNMEVFDALRKEPLYTPLLEARAQIESKQ